jgi:hypothetical protein
VIRTELSKKKLFAIIALTVVLSVSMGYTFQPSIIGHRDPKTSANVFIIFETARGTWEYPTGNVITNIGEQYDRNILGFNNVSNNNATKWIALGNSTIAATKTKLDTEAASLGFERALGTVTAWNNGTDYAYNVSCKFTATGTIRVNATSLQWCDIGESDNNCYALASITATTFSSGDNCTIRWVITRDDN